MNYNDAERAPEGKQQQYDVHGFYAPRLSGHPYAQARQDHHE
jgi:hypothetical protein